MGEIIIKKDFTAADLKKADIARSEYRRSKSTSKASAVLNMADNEKAITLCGDHVKQFATPAVLRKYGYRRVTETQVMGNCDYCGLHDRCTLFIHLSVFDQVWRTKEQRRVDHEYGAFVRG